MSEHVVITGASGAIGRRAVAALLAAGFDVTGIAGSDRARRVLAELGAGSATADVYDPAALERAFREAGADVVVNLLTRIPSPARMGLPGAWRENDRLRREASAAVARAAAAAGARRLVQESIALLYADGGDRWLDEDAPLDPVGPPAAALDAERNAAALHPDAVALRFGLFMAADSEQTLMQLAQARRGLSPAWTRRGGHVPTVWLEDAAAAVVAAVSAPAGVYNVVDDDPPTREEAEAAAAAAVGRERLRAPLAGLARVLPVLRPLERSLRVSNRRLRETTGWAPRVRAGVEGWRLAAEGASVAA